MPHDRAEVHLDIDPSRPAAPGAPRADEPFTIALLGDFSARASRGEAGGGAELAARGPVLVDRDSVEDAMRRLAPELHLALAALDGVGEAPVTLRVRELDDFHPDRLYETLPLFQPLRELRTRLADPRTFAAAARELGSVPAPRAAASGSVLDQMLDEAPPVAASRAPDAANAAAGARATYTPEDDFRAFVRQVVSPHLVPGRDPRQDKLVGELDGAITARMRALLHHPEFQALEALWRSVDFLVRRLDTDERLRVALIDVAKGELLADLGDTDDAKTSAVARLITTAAAQLPGAPPWSLLVGCYAFGETAEDVAALGGLAGIARSMRAPLVAGAHPRLVGAEALVGTPEPEDWSAASAPGWDELRRSPKACWVGLALPRFLLRLPYGAKAEPCERIRFEEVDAPPAHEDLLWGNAGICCALLLGQSFAEAGWHLRPGMHLDIGGLPLHLVRSEGGTFALPSAEALLTGGALEAILDRGLMPLAWVKDTDAVRLARFRSIAAPPAPLSGRWGPG